MCSMNQDPGTSTVRTGLVLRWPWQRSYCRAYIEIEIGDQPDHITLDIVTTMTPTASFNPPAANLPGKPFVPEWIPPPVTQEKHDFAQLKSIDLSLLDSEDPAVVENLIQQVKVAIRDDGFLFLENYGVSLEQVSTLLWWWWSIYRG